MSKYTTQNELLLKNLMKFYNEENNIEKILPIINGQSTLSIRIIDWFVTKYSRKNFVRYNLNNQEFLVYLSYKGQLKAYSKQYFDPNCRRERIMFKIPKHDAFTTTIGKLNFFRWALESKILDYIEEHEEEIRQGYNAYLKETMQAQKTLKIPMLQYNGLSLINHRKEDHLKIACKNQLLQALNQFLFAPLLDTQLQRD